MSLIDPLFHAMCDAGASDLHLSVGSPPIIRKDGRVDSVALLRHLDDRLDRSAQDALAQWVFQPALLDGAPIDVDAVFEIPFRLAPRPLK